jgi:hypothetical protein
VEAVADSAPDEELATLSTLLGLHAEHSPTHSDDVPSAAPSVALRLLQEISQYPTGLSLAPLGAALWQNLNELVSVNTLAVFVPSPNREAMICCLSSGKARHLFTDVEFRLGERITGWVAAHQTPIWNSDASLDLAGQTPESEGLSKCSSIPLVYDDTLVGVMSLYCDNDHEISLEHRFFLQALGPTLAQVVASSRPIDKAAVTIRADTDATREAVFAVLEPLFSSGNKADRLAADTGTPRVRLVVFPSHVERTNRTGADSSGLMLVEHALHASSTAGGFVVRLSDTVILLVTGTLGNAVNQALSASLDETLAHAKRLGIISREVSSALELRRILKEPGHSDAQTDRPGTRIH